MAHIGQRTRLRCSIRGKKFVFRLFCSLFINCGQYSGIRKLKFFVSLSQNKDIRPVCIKNSVTAAYNFLTCYGCGCARENNSEAITFSLFSSITPEIVLNFMLAICVKHVLTHSVQFRYSFASVLF